MLRRGNNPVMVADLNHQCRTWNILTRASLIFSYAEMDCVWAPPRMQLGTYINHKRLELLPRWRTAFLLKYCFLFGSKELRNLEPKQHFKRQIYSCKKMAWTREACQFIDKAMKKEVRWKEVSDLVKYYPAKEGTVIPILILGASQ